MQEKSEGSKVVKWILIGISFLFVFLMLILPLITVIIESLKQGWSVYAEAIADEYTVKALLLTLEATAFAVAINTVFGLFAAWLITKFHFNLIFVGLFSAARQRNKSRKQNRNRY